MDLIRKAGLTPWPRIYHNLRASRQTELAATFPSHVVCAWLGNSESIATAHYLQVTDADFERASAARSGAADSKVMQMPVQTAPDGEQQEMTHSTIPSELSHALSPQVIPCQYFTGIIP